MCLHVNLSKMKQSRDNVYIGSVTPETGSVELCAIWLYKPVLLKVRGDKFRVYGGIIDRMFQ